MTLHPLDFPVAPIQRASVQRSRGLHAGAIFQWAMEKQSDFLVQKRLSFRVPTMRQHQAQEVGGGGDGLLKLECIDYYWVHFMSYDGGNTWSYADNEEYAGCLFLSD